MHLDHRFANRQSKSQPFVLGIDLLEWFEYSVQRRSFQPYTVADNLEGDFSQDAIIGSKKNRPIFRGELAGVPEKIPKT